MEAFMLVLGTGWFPKERKAAVILKKESVAKRPKKGQYLVIEREEQGYAVKVRDIPPELFRNLERNPYFQKRTVDGYVWNRALAYARAAEGDSKQADRSAKAELEMRMGTEICLFLRMAGTPAESFFPEFRRRDPDVLQAMIPQRKRK